MDRGNKVVKVWFGNHLNFGIIPKFRATNYSPTIHCGAGATGKQGLLIIELWIK